MYANDLSIIVEKLLTYFIDLWTKKNNKSVSLAGCLVLDDVLLMGKSSDVTSDDKSSQFLFYS
jgi:hypothetical protein